MAVFKKVVTLWNNDITCALHRWLFFFPHRATGKHNNNKKKTLDQPPDMYSGKVVIPNMRMQWYV